MAHMVIFRTTDGKPAYHQTEALDDAVRFVEHLRNEEQVTDARIFTMTEVALEFKVHWRVEVATPIAPAVSGWATSSAMAEPDPPGGAESPEAAAEVAEGSSLSPTPSSSEDGEEQVPVAVGGGESIEDSVDGDLPASPPVPSASSRFGLFSRG